MFNVLAKGVLVVLPEVPYGRKSKDSAAMPERWEVLPAEWGVAEAIATLAVDPKIGIATRPIAATAAFHAACRHFPLEVARAIMDAALTAREALLEDIRDSK
jgi:hypothetical protein